MTGPGKVLVTGGSGFIGSHVVDALRACGHEPRIFDIEPSPFHAPEQVDTYLGELSDRRALDDAMTGCDAVLHLATIADVSEVALDPAWAEEVNSRGTLNVLESARAGGVERVVYASSIWVYNGLSGPLVNEAAALPLPTHLYTATKLAGEMYCTSYAELYDLGYTILRFGIPYGPRARPAAVVPQFVSRALAGQPLTIAGSGAQTRRFIHVEDLARGCVAALAPAAANRVYNLVGEEDTSIRQIADIVAALIGDTDVVHTEARLGDFHGVHVSPQRARKELGWQAEVAFAEGVARYVDWHQATHERPDSLRG